MTMQSDPTDEFADLAELMQDPYDASGAAAAAERAIRRRGLLRALLAVVIVVAVIAGAIGGYVGWALNAALPAPEASYAAPQLPEVTEAKIAVPVDGVARISIEGADEYFDAQTVEAAAAVGTEDPRSIASITKLITALVVLDAVPLADATDPGPTITFSEADHDLYDEYYVLGATIAAMPAGSSMSLRDALTMMLVPSASNYADAVATWAFGSRGAFLAAARTWLADHGLVSTTIVEPTGINPGNTSTVTDIIALGKLAAANPAIVRIAELRTFDHPVSGERWNTNGLLGTEGVTGLKSGNLGQGHHTLVYTSNLRVGPAISLRITGVVLEGFSQASVNANVETLLRSIRNGFREVPLVEHGQNVGEFTTPWGGTARMETARAASIFLWSDTEITMTTTLDPPAEYVNGEVIGSIEWTAGPHSAQVDIVARGVLAPPTDEWRLTNPGILWENR